MDLERDAVAAMARSCGHVASTPSTWPSGVFAPTRRQFSFATASRSPQDDGYGKVIAKLRPGGEFRSGHVPDASVFFLSRDGT